MAALPVWLQRWNFIDRAKLERQLWDASLINFQPI